MTDWHSMTLDQVIERLDTDPIRGLEENSANLRLRQDGPNRLEEQTVKSPWKILREQLTATMMIVLVAAAVISSFLGDQKDAVAILIIIILNAVMGFGQEYKAEKAMAALKSLAVPIVKVIRSGHLREAAAVEIAAGDLVLLEEGDLVPADCRILESGNLKIQESALTGESVPVEKSADRVPGEDVPLADRFNMAYMGTVVTSGRGRAVVTETGMRTELGRIASMIQTVEREPSPLQKRLERLGKTLAFAAIILVGIVVALGALRGEDPRTLFLTAISLAVAAVPEGLPAVITIALALGAQRMLKRRALIRKLPAVEALGSVTAICTDKTGTLTENRMNARKLYVLDQHFDLKAPIPEGEFPLSVQLLLIGGSLCSNAAIPDVGHPVDPAKAIGDPTEVAMVLAASRLGFYKAELETILPRVAEIPFDSERKRMTTIHRFANTDHPGWVEALGTGKYDDGSPVSFTKGAVDSLIAISSGALVGKSVEPFGPHREHVIQANNELAKEGMRVLGVAFRRLEAPNEAGADAERDLIFVGMVGIYDPARPEAKEAIEVSRSAGIRPIMITGDHPLTAQSIARELGLGSNPGTLTGRDLDGSIHDPGKILEEVSIFARVAPEHKLRIVEALQRQGHIVAMTGDGVNDAPALKKADIGIAMGITGTDVSKEVSDIVLMDDNFATIVSAIEEGRIIYDNIRKFVKYLLTTNTGEILVMLAAPFLGMPLPLLPLQILWINLVTDGLPALALGLEPGEPDVMRRPPRHPSESIFGQGLGRHILWVGILMGIIPLLPGYGYWSMGRETWQTMVFTTLAFSQMAHVLAIRSDRYSLFSIGISSNRPLLGAVILTSVLQIAVVYVPFLQQFFNTTALPPAEFAFCIALSSLIFCAVEMEKLFLRRGVSLQFAKKRR